MCLPAMWENWVRSLGREDPLEKEMATHSGILAWRIPWTEEPGGSTGSQRVGHDFTFTLFIPSSPLILVYCHSATSPESPGHLRVSLLAVAVALQLSSFQGCEVATGCAAFNCCAALCLASQTVPLRNGQVRRRAEPLRFWLTDCSLLSSAGSWLCCRCSEHQRLLPSPERLLHFLPLHRFYLGWVVLLLFLLYTPASSCHLSSFLSTECNTK